MNFRSLPKWLLHPTAVAVIAAVYYSTAELGRFLASTPDNVTPVWPPDGFALAAVLLLGYRVWPGIAIGAFFANIWAFLDTTNAASVAISIAIASSIAAGTTLSAILGSFLLHKFVGRRHLFDRPQNVFKFVVMGGMGGPIVSATAGITALCLRGIVPRADWAANWFTWWMSNAGGILIFTPLILAWSQPLVDAIQDVLALGTAGILPRIKLKLKYLKSLSSLVKLAEFSILILLVLAAGKIAFGGGYPVEYILIPFLVWAVFRFDIQGATLLIFTVSAIAVLGTVKGGGPFARPDLNESLVLLQSFIGVVVLTTLMLYAAIAQRQQVEDLLRVQTQQVEKTLRDLQQAQAQLIHSEKMSSLGQLVAGVAHEINNPVNFICGNLSYANEYTENLLSLIGMYQNCYPVPVPEIQNKIDKIELDFLIQDLPKLLSSMKIGTDRIQKIVLSLRNFSRMDESELKRVDIHEGLDSTLLILQHRLKSHAENASIEVIKKYSNLPKIECYASELNQVFMNIFANAIDALTEKRIHIKVEDVEILPRIEISTKILNKNCVIISIADNGSGMPEERITRIFDPFYTTKPVGKGTGLGLYISYNIISEKHRGKLKCVSEPDRGTEFIVELPIRQNNS
ncbi:MASE1 domain-containing protein [Microcoleus sp. herbarium19]|uniref:MASE1 domain-containing protein n=1 Tax=unclassified Microcoleus TaxID=2642155 RepID=UPI002FD33E75